MGERKIQSVGDILKDMQNSPEKIHEHNINRLIQEFGKEYKSEVIEIYNMERNIVEKSNSIPQEFIPTKIYEKAQEILYFNNYNQVPLDSFLSDKYI
jgi:hypothetical protein